MIGTIFTLTKKSDATKTVTFNNHASSSLIALQSYPTFEIDVRNDEMTKEGQHGVWDFFSYYGKRLITFDGVIIADNEAGVHTLKEALQSVLELPSQPTTSDDGTVIVKWTDPLGRALQTEAKISSILKFHRGLKQTFRLDFNFSLKSPDPIMESQIEYAVNGLRGYPLTGVVLPLKASFSMLTNYINHITVTNNGNTEADMTVKLYGGSVMTINNPTITNLTTGKSMTINVALTDATKYVSINSKTGEIVDQNGNDLSGNIQAGSEFVRLLVGDNSIFYTSDESYGVYSPQATHIDPSEVVESTHRDAII